MATLLSLPSPISQCCRSSRGRRGIPNMLKVCSLTCSSWALERGLVLEPGPPGRARAASVHACVYVGQLVFRWVDEESGALEEKGV